jgi:hypothetical protein
MTKFLISAAVAATAMAFATPAAAQYAPPYGNAYGYGQNNYGHVRSLQVRIDRLQRQIRQLDRRNVLSNREAARLRDDARDLERRLRHDARDGRGLNFNEVRAVEVRLVRLEQRLFRDARDGNRWGDQRYGDRDWNDRDRDGRNDRYEDDRGRDHD